MADTNARTQIIIACISVAGVIGAALIASHAGISGKPIQPDDQHQVAKDSTGSNPDTASHDGKRGTVPKASPPKPQLSSDPDTAVVLSAVPAPGSLLKQGQLTNFTVTLRYRLSSLQNATLNMEIDQFDRSPSCAGDGHIPVSQHVPIYHGEHEVTVTIPYTVGLDKQPVPTGSIKYGASIWSDFDNRQLFKRIQLDDYCYAFN